MMDIEHNIDTLNIKEYRYLTTIPTIDMTTEYVWKEAKEIRENVIRQQDRYDLIVNEERRYQKSINNYVGKVLEKFKKGDVLLIEYPI